MPQLPKRKILVVDDEPEVTKAVKTGLESYGYEVSIAYDGREGLDKIHRDSPDLVILDLMLPEISGYKVCRLLKYDKRYSRIPVIMFSARADRTGQQLAKEVGADVWITKPFNVSTMAQTIENLLAGKIERESKK